MLKRSAEMEPLTLVITLYAVLVAASTAVITATRGSKLPRSGKVITIQLVVYNGLALAITIPFFLHAGSSSIRPMGWSLLLCLIIIAQIISLFRACLRIETTEYKWVGFFLVPFLGFTPGISSGLVIEQAGNYAGFVLSD